jgi:hypothetical protein
MVVSWPSISRTRAIELLAAPLLCGSLVVIIATVIYRAPFRAFFDIGSDPAPISRLHSAERNEEITFAYSQGRSTIWLPGVGVGIYEVCLRMSGPGGSYPLPSTLTLAGREISIGAIGSMRTYCVLAPADDRGALAMRITSQTYQPPRDSRRLGVLFDQLSVRSMTPAPPPLILIAALTIAIGFSWMALVLLDGRITRSFAMLNIIAAGLLIGVWHFRGQSMTFAFSMAAIAGLAAFGAAIARPPTWITAHILRAAVMLFVLWRLVLWVVGWAALESSHSLFSVARLIATHGSVVNVGHITPEFVLGYAWVRWDSYWYLSIVEQGYQYEAGKTPNLVFFPLYPMLIRALMPITFNNAVLSGLIIANVSLLAGIILLTDLVARDFGAMVAYRTVSALLLFPTSFFFGALYTESLALALLALTLWSVRREHWWLAGIAGLFLSATRVPGVLIAPVLALALISRNGWRWPRFQPVLLTPLLPVAGLGLFMLYQWHRFGSPFVFLQVQKKGWDQQLSLPWVQLFMMIDTIATGSTHWSGHWPTRAFQLAVWLSFAGLAAVALRRLPLAYSLTTVMMLLPAYLTNVSHSLPRYVLLALPAFLMMALLIERRPALLATIPAALALLGWTTALFVNGFFVG